MLRPNFFFFLVNALLLLFSVKGFAQGDTVKLRIGITDSYTKRAVKGASVVDRTTGTTATTDINGYVETKAGRHDQLFIVASGYHALPISVGDSLGDNPFFLHLMIEPFSAGLNQSVIITGNKTLDNIGVDKQHLGITPPELKKPKIPVTNVVAQLYDKFGHDGKEREALKKDMISDDRWKVMTEYLNYCNDKKLIDLEQDKYGEFINYCDMSIAYLKTHADYEILTAISHKFETFAREKGLMK